MRGAAAEELFAELSRVERAPDELTGRVMGRVGYRPVTGREWTRRWWRRTSVRLAGVGVIVCVLGAAAVVLRERDGRHPDPVTVEAAVVQDVETARGRVAAALAGLRQLVPASPAVPASAGTVMDHPEPVKPRLAEAEVEPDGATPITPASEPVRGPSPGLGPSGFPSGGRAIDRLWSPQLAPSPGSRQTDSDRAELGPLTGRDPDPRSRAAGSWRLPA